MSRVGVCTCSGEEGQGRKRIIGKEERGNRGNNWEGGAGNQQTSSDLVTLKFSSLAGTFPVKF